MTQVTWEQKQTWGQEQKYMNAEMLQQANEPGVELGKSRRVQTA